MSGVESPAVRSRYEIRGLAVTDLSTILGAVGWLFVVFVLASDFDIVDRALSLAVLVLVPLGIGMAATPRFSGLAGRLCTAAILAQPVAAVLFVGSLFESVDGQTAAAIAAPWLLVTGLLALTALVRAHTRVSDHCGLTPLSETVIDAGLAYSVVGASALLLFHLDVTFWFSRTIIRLTAVHFHYAGFALPVITGLVGRAVDEQSRVYDAAASVVLVGPGIIAVGISFSPVVEVVAVSVFTLAVAVLAAFVLGRVVPSRPRAQGILLGLSALALPVSMALALGYAVSVFTNTDLGLRIPTMIRVHGSLNAFGFALLGLVGWRVAVPELES
ncbi:YndJ family protein [Haloarchaeobius sp. DFWS5]|uniref:YndJ family protein n=1 Tax=Haloarchaeobius sp. DFWS5 TaxID=3446114 RepID=UPI003EBEBA6D